jgi:hypothetical protein
LKQLADTIYRVFETLDKDDDTLYNSILEAKREYYGNFREAIDSKRGRNFEDKADLISIGSHRSIDYADPEFDDLAEGGQYDIEAINEANKSKNKKKKKKKKNQGFNMADMQTMQAMGMNDEEEVQEGQTEGNDADNLMAGLLAGAAVNKGNKKKGKRKRKR